jgi:hypothetical protein
MRSLVIATAAAFGLVGCVNPVDDMLSGQYSETTVVSPDPALVGTWTGSMSASLLTLKVNGDGTGLYCYSLNENNALGRLKYDGQRLVFQSSTTASVRDVRPDAIVIRSDYTFSKDAILRRDSGLLEASPYCTKAMQEAQ